MRKYALFGLVGLASCMVLASCGKENPDHQHSFSADWKSDEATHFHLCECGEKADVANHTFNASGFCSVCNYFSESKNFTEEKLGYLSGEFYAYDYVLNVSKDGATLAKGNEVTSLTNEKIEGTKYSTKVSYKGSDSRDYTLSWKAAEWDIYEFGYMLPTLEIAGNDGAMQFQPSIASIQGWYDGWEDEMDSSLEIYIVQNDFDSEANMFQMYGCNGSYEYIGRSFHLASSFVDVDGETRIGLSWFDDADLEAGHNYEDWNYWVKVNKNNNRLYMMWFEDAGAAWWARPSMLVQSYWKDEYSDLGLDALYEFGLYFTVDEDEQTVSIEDGDPITYETCLDENGVFYKVGDMEIRGTSTGLTIKEGESVEDYIPFFTSELYDIQYTGFVNGENTVKYDTDWDTWEDNFFINDEPADTISVIRYGDELAYKATKGDDTYIVVPFYDSDAVRVLKNDEDNLWFSEYLCWQFAGDYVTADGKTLTIGDDLMLYIGEDELGQGTYGYNEEFDVITLNCGEHSIFIANSDIGLLLDLTETGADMLLATWKANAIFGDWSNGKVSLSVETEKVTYNEKEYTFGGYTLLITGSGLVPAAKFFDLEDMFYFTFDDSGLTLFDADLLFVSSFVGNDVLPSIVGTYVYVGEYGEEKITYTADGKLFVSVMKDDKTGIETKEFDYNPFTYLDESTWEDFVVLEFIFKEVPVDIKFDFNGHASIFDIKYTSEAYLGIQGLYGTTSDKILSVIDTKITYNGYSFDVEEIDGNVFSGYLGWSDTCTMTFGENQVTVQVNDNDPVILEKNETQLEDFITPVHENVGNLNRDIKVTADGIFIRITGDEEFTKVTDYEYKIDDSGNVSIEFENSAAYKFTIKIEEGVVVITGESSLPPLPPPPPPFAPVL